MVNRVGLWLLVSAGTAAAFGSVAAACGADNRTPQIASTAATPMVRAIRLSWKTDAHERLVRIRTRDLVTNTSRTIDVLGAEGEASDITVAPSAERVAWLEHAQGLTVVAVGDFATRRVHRLVLPTARAPAVDGPVWRADARSLALAVTATSSDLACGGDDPSDLRLYVASGDLSRLRVIETPVAAVKRGTSNIITVSGWSPRGDRLLYQYERWGIPECRGGSSADLYVADVAKGSSRRLATGHGTYSGLPDAVWSPDGGFVAYAGGDTCSDGRAVLCTQMYDTAGNVVGRLRDGVDFDEYPVSAGLWWTRAGLFSERWLARTDEQLLFDHDPRSFIRRRTLRLGNWTPLAVSNDALILLVHSTDGRTRIVSRAGRVLLEAAAEPDSTIVLR